MFEDLWKAQYNIEGENKCSILRNIVLFQGVSKLTIYKLSYELLQTVTYKKGEVLFNDCSYMPDHSSKYIEMKRVSTKRG